jgi:hypothetical protein
VSAPPPDLPANVTATAWWESLSAADQAELASLCDPRHDDFFGPDADAPSVRGGRFVPHDDAWGLEDWGPAWFDHLLMNPELVEMWEPPQYRLGGICTRHPAARAVLAAGRISSDFACPFAASDCPMRRLLHASPTGSVRLAGLVMNDGTRRVIALPMV